MTATNASGTPGRSRRTWRITLQNALIITRREVRDSFRDWRIIIPIVLLTFFFPFLAQWVAARFSGFLSSYGAERIGDRTIPFLLMIVGFFPISISLVIALETFVGEKERRSLEPLLSTPLSNTELYIGKTLSSMIPPLVASFGGMSVYLFTLLFSELSWRPPAMLVVQIFLLTIVQALVMVTGAVVVSSQTTSTRAANLLASFIIVPMTLVINGESVIMFIAPDAESPRGIAALWAIIVGMSVAVVLLLRVGNSIFNREELLGRTIDNLNIIGILKKIGRYTTAVDDSGTSATGIIDWYRRAVPYSLRKLRQAALVTIGVFVVYFVVGYGVGQIPAYQLPLDGNLANLDLAGGLGVAPEGTDFLFFFQQNSRVLLIATFLSIMSFGTMAYILLPIAFLVLGYFASQLIPVGLTAVYLASVVPHGIVEIPIIVIATAAAFRVGAIITKPPQHQTVGQAWMMAMGDTIKIAIGIVMPGLFIAALLETYVTFPILQGIITNAIG